MAKGKMKENAHALEEKRADEEAAIAAQMHFSVAAVCGFVEKMFGEIRHKAA